MRSLFILMGLLATFVSGSAKAWDGHPQVRIVRYANSQNGLHRVTTANLNQWPWRTETSFGIESFQTRSNMALYECLKLDGSASFLSTGANCEGAVGYRSYTLGFISQGQTAGSLPLYRCNRYGIGHFASTDPRCERRRFRGEQIVAEGPLGYVQP